MSTIRPLAGPVRRSKSAGPFAAVCVVGLVSVLSLVGCSSKKASDTSAATLAETTVVAETTITSKTTLAAPVETSAVADSAASAETTAAALPTSSDAADDSAPLDAGIAPGTEDPQAAMEAAIVTGMSSQLGVTDPKQLACVTDSVKGADFAKPEGQGKILRGVLKCAPDAMAVSGAKSLRESNPTITEKQSICIVKATFGVLGAMADSELVAAMSSSKLGPEIVEATLAKAKGCGLSEAEIRKALQQ